MVRTGAVPRSDPFSLGAAGRPWIDVHWLFQLASYGAHRLGGLLALVVGKSLLVAVGALVLLAAVVRGASPDGAGDGQDAAAGDRRWLAAGLLAVLLPAGLLAIRHLLLVRPVIFTMLFLAAFLLVLESYRKSGNARLLLWLPPLQVIWANCQGLWGLGPALVAAYLVGGLAGRLLKAPELPAGAEKRLAGALAVCLAAGAVTPFGLRSFTFPLRLFGRITPDASNVFSRNIAENVPPFILERTMPGQVAPLAAVLALCALSFALARKELVLGRALAALGFASLALMANRNVLLFFWVGIPLAVMTLAGPLARLRERWRWRRAGAAGWSLVAVATAGLSVAGASALRGETPLDEPAPFRVPEASARIIAADPGAGRIFNADHYGGYLIWSLHPRARPFIDTRLVLRTADEYAEYLGLADHPERFPAFAERHRFDWAALPTEFPDRYLGLVQSLYRDPAWRLVYTDGTETLFRRASPQPKEPLHLGERAAVEWIVKEIHQRYGRDAEVLAAARRHLARLLLTVDEPEEARHVLTAATPDDLDAQSLLGRSQVLLGALDQAETVARTLIASRSHAAQGHLLSALAALARQDRARALEHVRHALAADPNDPESAAILEALSSDAQR